MNLFPHDILNKTMDNHIHRHVVEGCKLRQFRDREDFFRNLSPEVVVRPSLRQDRRPPRLSPSLHFPFLSTLPREPFRCSILCRRLRSRLLASNAIHLTDRREGTALQKCGRPERGGRYTRGKDPLDTKPFSFQGTSALRKDAKQVGLQNGNDRHVS